LRFGFKKFGMKFCSTRCARSGPSWKCDKFAHDLAWCLLIIVFQRWRWSKSRGCQESRTMTSTLAHSSSKNHATLESMK
jgi:hypothetical protein